MKKDKLLGLSIFYGKMQNEKKFWNAYDNVDFEERNDELLPFANVVPISSDLNAEEQYTNIAKILKKIL